MTKVNFKALDNYAIKPVGVYGSKEEIVRFLKELAAIDEIMYVIPRDCSSALIYPALVVRSNFFSPTPIYMWARNRPSAQACTSSQHQDGPGVLIRYSLYIGLKKRLGMTLRRLRFAAIASHL